MSSLDRPAAAKSITREDVVDAIRRRIHQADLVPGQRLVEAELSELLGASRGAVRGALVDLSHEGLVERIANRGARVRVVGLEEALQIAEVRLAIESLCVGHAAERITDAQIGGLRALATRMTEQADAQDIAGFAATTHDVFELYVRIAQQPVAEEMLARLRARNVRHGFRLTFRPGRAQVALPYWLAIIDAICARDAAGARRALRRHSENVRAEMRTVADEHRPFAAPYRPPTAAKG